MRVAALIFAATAAALAAAQAPARVDQHAGDPGPTTFIVGYAYDAALAKALSVAPARIVRNLPELRVAEVLPDDAATFAERTEHVTGISYVERPQRIRPMIEPAVAPADVPGGAFQWQYAVTRADEVPANVASDALNVGVAVIDSGADLTAPDIDAKHPLTHNAIDGSANVEDTSGHGTFVASLAVGSSSNGEGIAGVGGEARLYVVKASVEGLFTDYTAAAGLTYAVDRGAKVVNLSLGGFNASNTIRRAVRYAAAKDVLLVAAAGNEFQSGNPVEYPAALLQPVGSNGQGGLGLSVGASTIRGERAAFSNTGSHISLAAPGLNVFGALSKDSSPRYFPRVALPGSRKGLYGYASGTSFAAPQVAGAAAVVWAANPSLSAKQVGQILKSTASGQGQWNPDLGYGVIDVAAAVALAKVTAAVRLDVTKIGNAVRLSWRSQPLLQSFRLLVRVGNVPERVLLDKTSNLVHEFRGTAGVTNVFTVEALDASGAVVARSAPRTVTFGRGAATLKLKRFVRKLRNRRYDVLAAVLEPKAIDIRAGSRIVLLERFDGSRWRRVGFEFTDEGGRAMWLLPRGTHKLRARFGGTSDLAKVTSRPLTVRVP